ncbi:MAG: type II secretion system protein [Cyanobacteria bacterium SIG32]|nr:type II secretion system protein [Cyanobacteria bacterium SIG32]
MKNTVKNLITWSPSHLITSKRQAFTLAEVLITLAIIGVVAAMTIPTLITNFEKKANATRAKQSYAILQQAFALSIVDNGSPSEWILDVLGTGHSFENTEASLQKYLLPYLKSPIFCGNGYTEETIEKCGAANFNKGQTYFLANGTTLSITPTFGNNASHNIIFNMGIDVNGPKKPNMEGTDHFQFCLYGDGRFAPFKPTLSMTREEILAGKNIDLYESGTNYHVACKKAKVHESDHYYRLGCTALLMLDNWEFKDDYPY